MKKYISQWLRVLWVPLAICVGLLVMHPMGVGIKIAEKSALNKVTFYGSETSPISSAVAVPTGQAYFWTSGTVPPPINPDAPARTRDRFGDTKTQAIGTLNQIQTVVQNAGLSLDDVIYLRAYLVADPEKNNQVDYQGSTVGVAGLVDPGWLIEIEAVAVYPKKGDR
jgi:enamine deaminase RidA (YjgF/YER057c/UK114 family)